MKITEETEKEKAEHAAKKRHEHEAEAGVAGAVAGAALGAVAGPPGAIAGAVVGGIIGAVVAGVTELREGELAEEDRKLDEEIGVTAGTLGAPNLEHPPARTNTISAASAGAGTSGSTGAEGPISSPDD